MWFRHCTHVHIDRDSNTGTCVYSLITVGIHPFVYVVNASHHADNEAACSWRDRRSKPLSGKKAFQLVAEDATSWSG